LPSFEKIGGNSPPEADLRPLKAGEFRSARLFLKSEGVCQSSFVLLADNSRLRDQFDRAAFFTASLLVRFFV